MATAAEIRKRVRQAEESRVKARQAAALDVAAAHEKMAAAAAALTEAQGALRKAVATATRLDFSISDLAAVTGVSASALRSVGPSANGTKAAAAGPDEADSQVG